MPLSINPFESNPGWDLVKLLYGYYGLKDYVDFWYHENIGRSKILEIPAYDFDNNPGDGFFWKEVLSGSIIKGKRIRLLNFQISPWFPRKPGLFWTYDAAEARKRAVEYHVEKRNKYGVVLDVWGKTLMTEVGGVGSVNFSKERDYVLITATASGNTDEGIPLLCRKNVWTNIEGEFQKGRMIEVDLQGQLINLTHDTNSFILRSPAIPKVAILINSLLNIKVKASRLRINVAPWTIFETTRKERPYGFTFVSHKLFEDDIQDSKDWIESFVEQHHGKAVLTDFDESLHYLNAIFPLNDVTSGAIMENKIMAYSQKILRDFKKNN